MTRGRKVGFRASGPCKRCGGEKFYSYKRPNGLMTRRCAACSSAMHKDWWWNRAQKPRHNDVTKAARQARRMAMIQKYGGRCACCSEAELAFLTFDHIDNRGNAHRREIGSPHLGEWLYKQEGYVENIQILCFNCNLAKGKHGGVCPHESVHLIAGGVA